jgi:two-component system chemotaxis response regulator CheY
MHTVLIVDDSEYMRSLIKYHIRTLDVSVIGEAETGYSGVEKYKELSPDIVTMDLAMNDGTGLDAIREIISHNPQAKIIVISSTANQDVVIADAMKMGAKAVIDKNSIEGSLPNLIKELMAD